MYDPWKILEPFTAAFRVRRDPSEQDRLPMIPLKAKRGHVYVHGDDVLGAVYRTGKVSHFAGTLRRAFPGVKLHEAEGELLILWPTMAVWSVPLLDRLGAKRRKRYSPATLEKLRRVGKAHRTRQIGVTATKRAAESTNAVEVGIG